MKFHNYIIIFLLIATLSGTTNDRVSLADGRNLFYSSVDNKNDLKKAELIFQQLQHIDSLSGRATVYLGALMSIRGKHALLPINKYKKAIKGLEIMDSGILMNPVDIESRFIRGMTCFHLPFFFKRSDTAKEDFDFVMTHLSEHFHEYDKALIQNVVRYFKENLKLSDNDRKILNQVESDLNKHEI